MQFFNYYEDLENVKPGYCAKAFGEIVRNASGAGGYWKVTLSSMFMFSGFLGVGGDIEILIAISQ